MKKFMTRTALTGALAAMAMVAAPASLNADQYFADDVIVDGSLCVGQDCVNGESFGFDTMILKENNLRIYFNDTSNSASFPSNDWRLTANGSNNGDDSYFSIDDATAGRQVFRVDAGAPSNSLRVTSAGNVGVGLSTPNVELHVRDGDSPTLRLEQDGSAGFTAQTFDLVSNEANFFIRDVTNGSQLPFRIKPGADTDSLFIAADNDIGIGTDNPSSRLHVRSSSDNTTPTVLIDDAGTSSKAVLLLQLAAEPRLRFDNTANNSASAEWDIGLDNSDNFIMRTRLQNSNAFRLEHNGDLTITGELTTAGTTCNTGCDAVFTDAFDLPSIDDHSERMWEAGYLPNVGATIEGEPFNLTDKVGRMLNELEIAHIYIAQLHDRVEALEAEQN